VGTCKLRHLPDKPAGVGEKKKFSNLADELLSG